jgi:hypothetical protein
MVVAVDDDIFIAGLTDSFGAGGLDAFIVKHAAPAVYLSAVIILYIPGEMVRIDRAEKLIDKSI